MPWVFGPLVILTAGFRLPRCKVDVYPHIGSRNPHDMIKCGVL